MATMGEQEIRQILRDRGAPPAVVEQILVRYRSSQRSGAIGQWNDAQVMEWLEAQVEQVGQGGLYGTSPATRGSTYDVSSGAQGNVSAQAENDRDFQVVAEMARQAAAERRQQVQNATFEGARIDHGSQWDPAVIANSLGEGVWVGPGGGYINPSDGTPSEVPVPVDHNAIWQAIRGQTFNMGSLSMPSSNPPRSPREENRAPRGPFYGSGAPASIYGKTSASSYGPNRQSRENRRRRYMTPSMALSMLDNMDEGYLVQLQQQMFQAGLYPEESRPDWGEADIATREAFRQLFLEASMNPRLPLNKVLSDLIDRRVNAQEMTPGSPGAGGVQGVVDIPTLELPDFQPQVMNEEALKQGLSDLAQDLLGEYLPPEQMEQIKAQLREREISVQRQQYDSDVTRIREAYDAQVQNIREGAQHQAMLGGGQGGGGGQNPADVDAFLSAISGQESGGDYNAYNPSGASGKYQFMPDTWAAYARRAGLGAGAPMTPENQELVARQMAMDLYAQFGNWRDVAIAWYAGPGRVDDGPGVLNAPQGRYPSINEYADSIMNRMGQNQRAGVGPAGLIEVGGGQVGGRDLGPIEQFDPAAEMAALVKAADPVGYQTNEWGDRAQEFFAALSGAIGAGS